MNDDAEKAEADREFEAFVSAGGHSFDDLTPLAGDASARRYWRIPGRGILIMDDRGNADAFGRFLRIGTHLEGLGIRVPAIHRTDPEGLAEIEDLGDDSFERLLGENGNPARLYSAAIDLLKRLRGARRATAVEVPGQTSTRLADELDPFLDWYLPHVRDGVLTVHDRNRIRDAWRTALALVDEAPRTLVLRDFHAGNILRTAVGETAVLDFQDALIGAPEYDLVSLLQDARRDLDPDLEREMIRRFCGGRPSEQEMSRYAVLGSQRHARILGIFIRLWKEAGKDGYLVHLGRVQRQLAASLAHPVLAEVRACLFEIAPEWEILRGGSAK